MKTRWWMFVVTALLLVTALVGCAAMSPADRRASSPSGKPVAYQPLTIAEAGLELDVPSGWQRLEPGWTWAPNDVDGYYVGVNWADLEPPMEAEAAMLPSPPLVLDSVPVDLGWGSGHWLTIDVYAPAALGEGSDAAPSVQAVETHALVVVNQGDGRRAYDFYASAPNADLLSTLDPILDAMVSSVELRVPSVLLTRVPVTVVPPVCSSRPPAACGASMQMDSRPCSLPIPLRIYRRTLGRVVWADRSCVFEGMAGWCQTTSGSPT